jgi:hypothetical protein
MFGAGSSRCVLLLVAGAAHFLMMTMTPTRWIPGRPAPPWMSLSTMAAAMTIQMVVAGNFHQTGPRLSQDVLVCATGSTEKLENSLARTQAVVQVVTKTQTASHTVRL